MSITPIIDTAAIKNNIAAFIQAVTGQTGPGTPFTWFYEFQSATKPKKPYVGYKITGPRKVGSLDEIRAFQLTDNEGDPVTDNEGDPIVAGYNKTGERVYTVSINCVSDAETEMELATELATNIMAALEQPQFISILEKNGCSVWEIMPVQDISALIPDATKFERRVLIEFYFAVPSTALYDSGQLTTYQGQIQANTQGGEELIAPLPPKTS